MMIVKHNAIPGKRDMIMPWMAFRTTCLAGVGQSLYRAPGRINRERVVAVNTRLKM